MMKIAIIGCGNMGSSFAEYLSASHQVFLYDRHHDRAQKLAQKVKGKTFQNLTQALENAQIVLLAIKPQNLKEAAAQLEGQLKPEQIVISMLSGTPLAILKNYLPGPILIRMMPNLAIRYGMGVIGLVDSTDLSNELKNQLEGLFKPLGLVYWLKENQIDALTSLTGSGPAFFLSLIEAVIEAGIAMGFQAKDAQDLVLQMLQGTIGLLQKAGDHPAALKWQITSPNGTTIAGLRVLEREHIRSGLMETFLAAYQRSQELAKEFDS